MTLAIDQTIVSLKMLKNKYMFKTKKVEPISMWILKDQSQRGLDQRCFD